MLIASDTITSSRPTVKSALKTRDEEAIVGACRRARDKGAKWLDLNPGYVKGDTERHEIWSFLVSAAESACDLTLMLDAPDPETLALALSMCTRAPVLNMASAAESRLGPTLDLAAHHEIDVVCGLFTDTVPIAVEERFELAAVILGEAMARGLEASRLVLDPIVMPLAIPDGERHAASVLDLLRMVPQAFDDPPRTMIGLSNLTTKTAGSGSKFVSAPFLYSAFGAGVDVVLLDTDDRALVEAIRLCRVFAGEHIFTAEEQLTS